MKLAALSAAQPTVAAALKRASETTGVGFELLYNMAKRESAFDPKAQASGTSAAGLFQFIDQTWLGAVKQYGAAHGLEVEAAAISQTSSGKYVVADPAKRQEILDLRLDPMKAAAVAGELIEANRQGLERRLGRTVSAAEVYSAHFLGLGGAVKFLSASPEAEAAAVVPHAAAANHNVFFDGERAKSVGEVMASLSRTMGEGASAPRPSLAETSVKAAAEGAVVAPSPLEKKGFALADFSAARSFAPSGAISVSPLTLAVLGAIDPTRLGEKRDEI
ncbi:MAG TPA: transglycosylase SLT domain-containing protein [Parvularculaceae bacterium]|nr:transglycosylase SLT domain-containing protein [Parvularculaceae bacterium]